MRWVSWWRKWRPTPPAPKVMSGNVDIKQLLMFNNWKEVNQNYTWPIQELSCLASFSFKLCLLLNWMAKDRKEQSLKRFIVQLTYNSYVYLVFFRHFGMNVFDVHERCEFG